MIRDFMCYICRQPSNRVKLCNNVPVCMQCYREIKDEKREEAIIPEGRVAHFFFADYLYRSGRLTEWPKTGAVTLS